MADIEKVITGLELCTNISPDGCLMLCPYKDEKDETYSGFCEQVLKRDALELLKEKEPVKPIILAEEIGGMKAKCGKCFTPINYWDKPKFCNECGQPIKWSEVYCAEDNLTK